MGLDSITPSMENKQIAGKANKAGKQGSTSDRKENQIVYQTLIIILMKP